MDRYTKGQVYLNDAYFAWNWFQGGKVNKQVIPVMSCGVGTFFRQQFY